MIDQQANFVLDNIQQRKAGIVRNAIWALFVVLIIVGVSAVLVGATLQAATMAFALVALRIAQYYNRSGSTRVALTLLLGAFWICATVGSLTTGGVESVVMAWFAILVCLAGLLGGRRHCLVWAGVSLSTILALWAIDAWWFDLSQLQADESKAWPLRLHILMQLSVVSAIVLSWNQIDEEADLQAAEQMGRMSHEGDQRRRAEALAEASDNAKTQFLTNMSHEIRTPLNSIIGFSARLLKQDEFDYSKDYEAIECIQRNGKALLALVNELLELSDMESTRLHYSNVPFSADTVIEECVLALQDTATAFGLQLQFERVSEVYITADQARLHQIVANLIQFAIRQTQDGVIDVVVSSAARGATPGLQVVVADSSPGISKEQLDGLFEIHYQFVLNSSKDLPISALALALSAKLVRMHGGQIDAQSDIGKGTTFTIWLPLSPGGGTPQATPEG